MNTKHDALREALKSIQRYGWDTLSGRTDGPDDREWQRAAVKEMTKRATEALSLPMPEAAAQGWKLVPVEPTHAMELAGVRVRYQGEENDVGNIYSAMLSASPAAPEGAKAEQDEDETPPSLPPNQYAEFWERLPGHLIDNHEGEELTEELLQRAAADLYAKFPALVESGLQPFGLLLLEERATTRRLTRALREATEAPTFMGEPVAAQPPHPQPQARGEPSDYQELIDKLDIRISNLDEALDQHRTALEECVGLLNRLPWNEGYADEVDAAITHANQVLEGGWK